MDNNISYNKLFDIISAGLRTVQRTVDGVSCDCPTKDLSERQLALLHESVGGVKALELMFSVLQVTSPCYGDDILAVNEKQLQKLFTDVEKTIHILLQKK